LFEQLLTRAATNMDMLALRDFSNQTIGLGSPHDIFPDSPSLLESSGQTTV
jgi:hypothetical protein